MVEKVLHNDKPITEPADDRFGIDPFAKSLASSIRKLMSPEGTVIALNGQYGVGKSSVVNLVLYHLKEAIAANEIAIINFTCWWFRGEEALALAFFRELYAGLGPTLRRHPCESALLLHQIHAYIMQIQKGDEKRMTLSECTTRADAKSVPAHDKQRSAAQGHIRSKLTSCWDQRRASASRLCGQWNDNDFDVLTDGIVVGRIFNANAAPVGSPWMWTLIFPHHEAARQGYEAIREAAMEAFAKSWQQE